MANELEALGPSTGLTVRGVIFDVQGGVWNGSAFVAYAAGDLASYAVPFVEIGQSRVYQASMPAVAAGVYRVVVYRLAGAVLAASDVAIAAGEFQWSGSSASPGGVEEPVSLALAKCHCRLDPTFTADDALVSGLISAARRLAESHTGRAFGGRTVTVTMDGFPRPPGLLRPVGHPGGPGWHRAWPIRLPVEPVSAVTAVRYRAADGTLTTLDPSEYQACLSAAPPVLAPAPGGSWPPTQAGRLASVEIDLTCGGSVPETARQAILLAVGYWYAHRGDGGDPERMGLPPAALRLLDMLDTGGY